ncbi:MAG: valine--tRNA ligase [Pirellulaceae bacterium]|nr:valine--tRNA ligase [Pirellulaceae bacterium]
MWEEKGYLCTKPDSEKKPFTIVIPPPNVTGALHLGHALNCTLQDTLIRFKRMQGYSALWMPGTDHAGIATQAVVEKRLYEEEGKTRHDFGRNELVKRIWDWKDQYETRILSQLKEMGCSPDWQRTRFTLDPVCAKAVRHTFYDLFEKKLIYRGKRLVNWDTFLQTTVSDDEVFHETVSGHFWHFQYPVVDPKEGEPTHVTIATTRPETMLGDTAVAVHPDPATALNVIETELSERLAKGPEKEREALEKQIQEIQTRREMVLPQLILLRDMAQDGRNLMLPLLDREIPLVADSWAKPELGSGCVKITPAHDPNDYEVGLRAGLPMINILNPEGTLNSNAGPYKGLTMSKARRQVVADLEELGLMLKIEDREIDLAHSDRSKTPIEPYLADQWFIKMEELAQSAMDAVTDESVQIFPKRYGKGYLDWLSEKRDWPVSRQLWWGHQIPIWSQVCKTEEEHDQLVRELQNDSAVVSGEVAYQVELDVERQSAEAHGGVVHGAAKVQLPYATIHVCIQEENKEFAARYEESGFVRESDVLDTWFSSALWPHSTLGWPEKNADFDYFFPTDVLITSRDIITLWVARMVLASLNNTGEVPFRRVFIHPKILDGFGETMSKSKGNGVDPVDVIQKFGADALRFSLAYITTETQDVRMPVQFECPHCSELLPQTKKNRVLPVIECTSCKKIFSTQWANTDEEKRAPRGAVVSERFETSRNFVNKLWNASRFVMMNLEGFEPEPIDHALLALEDHWILSRLSTVTTKVTEALEHFHYGEAMRQVYDFAWDEFCSFYVEMAKNRLQNRESRAVAQQVMAYVLDNLLRLLHPVMPFVTEEIWQLFGEVSPARGLETIEVAHESVMVSSWPAVGTRYQNPVIEDQFQKFQQTLGALREIRSRQNIAPKKSLEFLVECPDDVTELLKPMEPYFSSMANAKGVCWQEKVEIPETNAHLQLDGFDIYVDLKDFIDVKAELKRNRKQQEKLEKMVLGKEKKLQNEGFLARAPENVVETERQSLVTLQEQLHAVMVAIERLEKIEALAQK